MFGFISAITAVVAFAVAAVSGLFLIPFLKKLKYGQTINDIGPTWHKKKQGTPTMGGIIFIVAILVAMVVGLLTFRPAGYSHETIRVLYGLLAAVAFGFIGFIDDYIKVVKKRNLGLTARQKLVMQFAFAILYLWGLYVTGDTSTRVIIPFIGQLELGFFYYPIMVVFIVLVVNSVNLTDGLDGLASSVTFVASLGFMVICSMLSYFQVSLMATATAAALLGFLIYNFYPAKVFMGDTGSMFLGGMVVAMAFSINMPLLLILVGIIYLVESGSVVLQVASFKLTGKRIFKMSPIHHHFEMNGNSEVKIDLTFSLVTLVGVLLAILAIKLM